jgi:5-methyltetrahydrofolate--homocysteine methyltransferase
MADYHLEDIVYELNYESAKIAREVADAFTAKTQISPDLLRVPGPTNRTACRQNDPGYRAVSFDDLRIAYKQQVEA